MALSFIISAALLGCSSEKQTDSENAVTDTAETDSSADSGENPDAEDAKAVVSKSNIGGLSVYSAENAVSFGGQFDTDGQSDTDGRSDTDGQMYSLGQGETLLFVNGSVAPGGSTYIVDGDIYLSCGALSEISSDALTADCERLSIDGNSFISMADAELLLGCSVLYCDTYYPDGIYMLQSCPHIIVSRYPEEIHGKTEDAATELLKGQLIRAFNNKYGDFEPRDNAPDGYDEKENLRFLISSLSPKSENDRFYIFECIFDFYVDKYSDDIFVHYNGYDESFWSFDPDSESALSFAG